MDWYPTLLTLAGVSSSDIDDTGTDGVDMWPLLTHDTSVRSSFVYNIDIDDESDAFQFAVRSGSYKLMLGNPKELKQTRKKREDILLFNLDNDPEEKFNLAKKEPKTVIKLKNVIKLYVEGVKMAFQPNAPNLGYPRYHQGVLESGWCSTGWWQLIWNNNITAEVLQRI